MISITISTTPGADQAKELEDAMAALGFRRDSTASRTQPAPAGAAGAWRHESATENAAAAQHIREIVRERLEKAEALRDAAAAKEAAEMTAGQAEAHSDVEGMFTLSDPPLSPEIVKEVAIIEAAHHDAVVGAVYPGRVPGQPSPGKKRRTSAEVAEDDAFFAKQPAGNFTDPSKAPHAAISTGDERVDPEVAARDKADEKAEVAANSTGKLTHDDIREAVAALTREIGIAAAQRVVPEVLGCPIIAVPDTQEDLRKAIAALGDATLKAQKGKPLDMAALANEVGVELPAQGAAFTAGQASLFDETPKPEPKKTLAELIAEAVKDDDVHATFDDIVEACKAYARKYDGSDKDLSKAMAMQTDIPQVLEKALGVRKATEIPRDPKSFGRALSAINAAYRGNLFGRGKKT